MAITILYHHRTQGTGVESIHICNIIKALEDLNYKVLIISPPGCNPIKGGKEDPDSSAKIIKPIFSLLSRKCPEYVFECFELIYNIRAFFQIKRTITKKQIDLIYERYFLFSLASMVLAKKYNIPIFYEVNDSSFVPRLRQLKFIKLARYIERKVFSKADVLITVTKYLKNQLINEYIPADKIVVSQNAVDPAVFNPENTKEIDLLIPDDCCVIGFVGLFVKWVGLESFICLYHKICSEFPKTHLLLIGSGPEEGNIRKVIKELGLQFNITITGQIPHENIPDYINFMDICVIPRHERYTSPIKLFEYMSMGKAVLVPEYESLKEVVRHRENGMLFPPDDDVRLLESLREMIRDEKLIRYLGRNARISVLKEHTWQHNARQIEMELKRVCR